MQNDDVVASQEGAVLAESDFAYVSAAELARRVREGQVTSAELVEACIERIESRNPSLNAFVYKGFR
jgi:amidase